MIDVGFDTGRSREPNVVTTVLTRGRHEGEMMPTEARSKSDMRNGSRAREHSRL